MTKRLFISLDFPPENGGIQNYVYGLVSNLNSLDTFVLTSNRIGEEKFRDFDAKQTFKTYRIGMTNKVSFIKQILQAVVLFFYVVSLIRKHKIEEIHFGNVMPIGIIGPIIKRLLRIRYYPYIHGFDFLESKNNALKYKLVQFCLRHANKIICNSNYTKNKLMESDLEERNITVIHPGIHKKKAATINAQSLISKFMLEDRKVIITVGRLVKRKGHDLVIKSLREIIKITPNVKYVICGDGPEEENLKLLVKDLDLEDYVVFTGSISREDLETIYSIADLFIMLNRELTETGDVEGYGIVFLEAGMYKLPVIGGNNGGVPDAVLHGKTGYLIDPSSQEEIVQTVSSFFMDQDLAKQFGNNGYRWVTENCLWNHRVTLVESLEG
ncbi:glycosyltransferase family 4 protein [Evansella sp. AB-rgal1]|uniref:glycosyltransferase family 4 protein n=1 Tax=Evansella sp. AB-rgal1 TaxID=3242696 RepID=UPI00359D17A0